MNANEFLEDSLDRLAADLDALWADHSSELEGIRQALANIAGRGTEPGEFRRSLMELAEAVIDVRKAHRGHQSLGKLPVPPYDLWLPFKARDFAPSDPEDLSETAPMFNHKVSQLAFRYSPAGAARENVQINHKKGGEPSDKDGA